MDPCYSPWSNRQGKRLSAPHGTWPPVHRRADGAGRGRNRWHRGDPHGPAPGGGKGAGLTYLAANAVLLPGPTVVASLRSDIHKLAKELRQEAREQLASHLAQMNPFKFEELIKLLLEEMGYDDVETTTPTNDKGVDVVANIELGISSVREVIQVKRHKGSLNRTVLDQLRGSLHRFNAVRGTVISTGKFSKGALEAAFERGAAPITLIDGDKLLDLLMERQIGVTKKSVEYYEFDPAKLAQFEIETSADGSAR